jgi:glycosyltransferase involved in cell wall biosynthesis
MNILYLTYYYLPHVGGGALGTYYLTLHISEKGHHVELIVPNIQHIMSLQNSSSLENENKSTVRKNIILIPRCLGPLISNFFIFFDGLKYGRDAQIIISQYHPHHLVSSLAIYLGKIFRIPVIIRADDIYRKIDNTKNWYDLFLRIMNTFNENLIKYSDFFLLTCSEQKEILKARLGNNSSSHSIGLSYNGVELSKFNIHRYTKEFSRESLGIGQDEKILLFVGRFSGKEYGIDILLNALSVVSKKDSNVILILVGDLLSHEQKSLIDSLKIKQNIRVYGPTVPEKIIKFVMAADICIGPLMPTLAIPLKVLEYMACGKPVITGKNSISRDLMKNYVNGLMVKPNYFELASAISDVLYDDNLKANLGENARKSAERFGWNLISEDLLKLSYDLIASKKESMKND